MAAASRRQLIILVLLLGLAPHSFRLPANAQNAQLPHTWRFQVWGAGGILEGTLRCFKYAPAILLSNHSRQALPGRNGDCAQTWAAPFAGAAAPASIISPITAAHLSYDRHVTWLECCSLAVSLVGLAAVGECRCAGWPCRVSVTVALWSGVRSDAKAPTLQLKFVWQQPTVTEFSSQRMQVLRWWTVLSDRACQPSPQAMPGVAWKFGFFPVVFRTKKAADWLRPFIHPVS